MSNYLINEKKTEYTVLLPENSTLYEEYAAKELVKYLKQSTGCELDIKKDSFVCDKFISVGETKQKKAKNFTALYGKDGYQVSVANNSLYLFGESEYGAIWAVYGLLEKCVNFKYFAKNAINVDKHNEIELITDDFSYTPTMASRCTGFGLAKFDLEYATGLRGYAWYGQKLDESSIWGVWAHSHIGFFMPLEKYYDAHPDWYSADKKQLCLSNMQMRDEFFKNLITAILENPTKKYFNLGQEDNDFFCECEKCTKKVKEINRTGLLLEFVNDMARRVKAWQKQNGVDREIVISFFSYGEFGIVPPVKKVDGKYVPIREDLVAEDNVMVIHAPLGLTLDHSKAITDRDNEYIKEMISAWKCVCDRCGVWLYYGSFRRNFDFNDGLYSFKDNVEFFMDKNCEYYYVESNSSKGGVALQALTLYIHTRLEWDCTLDVNDLICEFCNGYYGPAGNAMKSYVCYVENYFDKTRARIEKLTGEPFHKGMCLTDTVPVGFYDLNMVYDLTLLIEEGENAVKNSGLSENEKQAYLNRLDMERLTLYFIQIEYFMKAQSEYDELRTVHAYSKDAGLKIVDEFEKIFKRLQLTSIDGNGTPEEVIAMWRKRIEDAPRFWENRMNKNFQKIKDKKA